MDEEYKALIMRFKLKFNQKIEINKERLRNEIYC